jgi:hypothetical protein
LNIVPVINILAGSIYNVALDVCKRSSCLSNNPIVVQGGANLFRRLLRASEKGTFSRKIYNSSFKGKFIEAIRDVLIQTGVYLQTLLKENIINLS